MPHQARTSRRLPERAMVCVSSPTSHRFNHLSLLTFPKELFRLVAKVISVAHS